MPKRASLWLPVPETNLRIPQIPLKPPWNILKLPNAPPPSLNAPLKHLKTSIQVPYKTHQNPLQFTVIGFIGDILIYLCFELFFIPKVKKYCFNLKYVPYKMFPWNSSRSSRAIPAEVPENSSRTFSGIPSRVLQEIHKEIISGLIILSGVPKKISQEFHRKSSRSS